MNENIVELLLYMFENYIYDNEDEELDKHSIQQGLTHAGFSTKTIDHAFSWLDNLQTDVNTYQNIQMGADSFRVFSNVEQLKLDYECRDFIYYLNNSEILDNVQREILINAIMNLDADDIDIDDLQWLSLMVLFSQPDQEQAFAYLEALMFDFDDLYEH
jgi:Smg protein